MARSTPPTNPTDAAAPGCECGYSRRGLAAGAACPECGLTTPGIHRTATQASARRLSVWTLAGSVVITIIQIGLIINYEVAGGGDGFMLFPVLPWIFIILPGGFAGLILNIVSWGVDGFSRATIINTIRIAAAALLPPAIVVYTVMFHARFP